MGVGPGGVPHPGGREALEPFGVVVLGEAAQLALGSHDGGASEQLVSRPDSVAQEVHALRVVRDHPARETKAHFLGGEFFGLAEQLHHRLPLRSAQDDDIVHVAVPA